MARNLLRRAAESPTLGPAIRALEALESRRTNLLRVLTYHHVEEAEPFARQVQHLARRYPVVSVQQVLTALDGGFPLPPLAVLLTFDDAYQDFARVAWPILREHGLPAVLFVPTAYPDSEAEGFWWDRLERAFARTERREALATRIGSFPLGTSAERAHAHAAVKRFVKDLSHRETLEETRAICGQLGLENGKHEVLGWNELRSLAREGVSLGAHTRTHPRLDRISFEEAREEIIGSLRDLEREAPGGYRLFAYPDGRFNDRIVDLLDGSGVELAFTTRHGTNDLRTSDRLRLRRIHLDARDSLSVLRAKLVYSSVRWNRARRLAQPPSRHERQSERSAWVERLRSRVLYRSLDAALTAQLRPRQARFSLLRLSNPRLSNYDRIGMLVSLAGLDERLGNMLVRPRRLAFRSPSVELMSFGSGTTVFSLDQGGERPRVLKVYRRTLGLHLSRLLLLARRYRARSRQFTSWFGEVVHPTQYLILHGPLLGRPAVACVQDYLPGPLIDPLQLGEAELVRLLDSDPGLRRQFDAFARRCLALRQEGVFPDLLGRGNLVLLAGTQGGGALRMIDCGVFDLRHPSMQTLLPRVEQVAARLRAALGETAP